MAPDGYVWWYIDGLSDDGRHGITVIAFLGAVFSPYYAWARRRGPADPLAHCALNVVLYGQAGHRWALTERGADRVRRDATTLGIGPSALDWDGETLTVRVEEVTAPWPTRLSGVVRVRPAAVTGREFALDAEGRHRWWPIAPLAQVEVAFDRPNLRWSGAGYLDTNGGDRALERDFRHWNWCRAPLRDGAAVIYDVTRRDGSEQVLALRCAGNGAVEDVEVPPALDLPPTRWWRMPRPTRAEAGRARVVSTLEDAPFYARSQLSTRLLGEEVPAMHESLSLDRFDRLAVQAMLPFRVPRALR